MQKHTITLIILILALTIAITAVLVIKFSPSISKVNLPVGSWKSVDLVQNIQDFHPDQISNNKNVFSKDIQILTNGTTSIRWMNWEEGWIIHSDGKTKYPYTIKKLNGNEYLFLPWLSGDVTIRGKEPIYYVLKKASNVPGITPTKKPSVFFQTIQQVHSVEEYDDVRWKDLVSLDLSKRPDLIRTLTYNEKTVWPDSSKMPEGNDPSQILKEAMRPPLGVMDLHAQGITGKGVHVAIIDQPLYQDHPEFAGKISAYHDVGSNRESSMHGPAVASLLVGAQCGTAPDAKLSYVAVPSGKRDAGYYAKALEWIIEQNRKLPVSEKIRVVSVSAAPSGPVTSYRNKPMWDKACARAESDGILILDCTSHHGWIASSYHEPDVPDDVSKCKPGVPGLDRKKHFIKLLVPSSRRTTAEEHKKGDFSHQYCGRAGPSWSIPYAAGVLAMGWQIQPDLSAEEMKKHLMDSAHVTTEGNKIINPKAFIQKLKELN